MTTRRQMLKIKVFWRIFSIFSVSNHESQGMSEAKVEKIKVRRPTDFPCYSMSQNSAIRTRLLRSSLVLIQSIPAWLTMDQGSSFATGVEVQDRRKRVIIISTGSKAVDGILGGQSFPICSIFQIFTRVQVV
jgi:meiotic recombination protein DMC1